MKPAEIYLLLHNIRSEHNVGSLFRTADAAGISTIYISGYTPAPIDRFGREVKALSKVALGGEHTVPWEKIDDVIKFLKEIKKNKKMQIVALEQDKRAVDYKKVTMKSPALFIVGNEVEGVSKEILDMCDVIAEIPMKGAKESLNVAVSAGIALFRILNI